MPIPDDTREFTPVDADRDSTKSRLYVIKDGKVFWGPAYQVRGADPETFRFYLGGWAKDKDYCYCQNSRLKSGNPTTFRALNFTFATDGRTVWTLGGAIEDADAESFVVCDDGIWKLGSGARAPHGYGKDIHKVYYHNSEGKPKWVRKATPASFVSLNDGFYGKDESFVFYGAAQLKYAQVDTWVKIGGLYSRDAKRIFYDNRTIECADHDSFEHVPCYSLQLAKDKNHYYWNDHIVDVKQFKQFQKKDAEFERKMKAKIKKDVTVHRF